MNTVTRSNNFQIDPNRFHKEAMRTGELKEK